MAKRENEAYHIMCAPGEVGEYCILPGDPGRCESIAALFEDAVKVAENREFVTYTGKLDGKRVSVCSTGIGGPSAAIAIEELAALGAHTFIRVGTCGGINLRVKAGDLVIATAAVRQEGTTLHYAPIEYPAAADFSVTTALYDAAKASGKYFHLGVVQSKDSFYGQHAPGRMPVEGELLLKWEAWKRLGVLASEMEMASLFVTGASLGVRCGGILLAVWNQEREKEGLEQKEVLDTSAAVKTAVEALKLIIKRDRS